VFAGFVKAWNKTYAPKLAELYRYEIPSDDEKEAVFRDWDKYICPND
jgi:hypothetical protein